jgi:hypothetical protein
VTNDDATTTTDLDLDLEPDFDEPTLCETCQAVLGNDHDDSEYGDQCQACYTASHFRCRDCEYDFELEDQSPKNKSLCVSCQESRDEEARQELHDKATGIARDLLEAIIDLDDLDAIKRAVAALKRLQPK